MLLMAFDSKDKQILSILQNNGRISNAELAEQVNLSPTPCLRRVRQLEDKKVISRYSAQLDPKKLGLSISAFIFIQLERNQLGSADEFEQAMLALPEVLDCYVLAGSYDYMLRTVAEDLESYERFIKVKLSAVTQIAKIDTTIALKNVKENSVLPIF